MLQNSVGLRIQGDFNQDIDASNTVNGKFIYYLVGLNNTTITPTTHPNAGQLYCFGCDGVTIQDFVFDAGANQAVVLGGGSQNCVVRRVTVRNYEEGLVLDGSSDNLLTENIVTNAYSSHTPRRECPKTTFWVTLASSTSMAASTTK